ncbi:MAG: DUF3343 domain-containing protein [Oscillibacter sp.]|nr:DUF3343 domain-containing protein [Oscillibacter sp.]
MKKYLMIARSVTHAQRMELALSRIGIRPQVFHAPLELTAGHGCAYAVQVRESDFQVALKAVYGAGANPVAIFLTDGTQFQEVRV